MIINLRITRLIVFNRFIFHR